MQDIQKAVNILRAGGLVAIPTETVYGLAADANNPLALQKIFHAKGRPIDHPLIVHIADVAQLSEWASDIGVDAKILANKFWPGPLTLILKKKANVLDLVTGKQDTIGIRVPNHPVAQKVLQAFGGGVAAPSANRFGRISPTTALAVHEELGTAVDLILDGGESAVGVESTIVDVSGAEPVILRPGMISATQIAEALGKRIFLTKRNAPRVSGSLESHYAPETPAKLISSAEINTFLQEVKDQDLPLAVVTRKKINIHNKNINLILMPDEPKDFAHFLYQTLRNLDKKNFKSIIIEAVPDSEEWAGIQDRLMRLSS